MISIIELVQGARLPLLMNQNLRRNEPCLQEDFSIFR